MSEHARELIATAGLILGDEAQAPETRLFAQDVWRLLNTLVDVLQDAEQREIGHADAVGLLHVACERAPAPRTAPGRRAE